jgi:uncharacterized membrane protein
LLTIFQSNKIKQPKKQKQTQMTMAVAPMVFSIIAFVLRGLREDSNTRKFLGVANSAIGFVFTGFALMSFGAGCYTAAPGTWNVVQENYSLNKEIGPGMALALLSFVCQFGFTLAHVIVPSAKLNALPTKSTAPTAQPDNKRSLLPANGWFNAD